MQRRTTRKREIETHRDCPGRNRGSSARCRDTREFSSQRLGARERAGTNGKDCSIPRDRYVLFGATLLSADGSLILILIRESPALHWSLPIALCAQDPLARFVRGAGRGRPRRISRIHKWTDKREQCILRGEYRGDAMASRLIVTYLIGN